MAKQPFTFESNLEKVVAKIEEKPFKVLNTIGGNLVREIKPQVPKRTGALKKSLRYSTNRKTYKESTGSWPPSRTPFLMVGFTKFYAPMVYKTEKDPIKPVIVKNNKLIQEMLGKALDEIRKE